MRINADSFVGVGICILGLVGVGYAIGVHSKMKVMCDRLDTSIDNLANNTEIDIPAKVIDQAVQKAVERESYSAVKRAHGGGHGRREAGDREPGGHGGKSPV